MPRVPRLPSGHSPRALNLSPPEAYLLSRVDAMLDEGDLALVTGMPPDQVAALLDRLLMLGAVEIVEAAVAIRSPLEPPPAPSSRRGFGGGAYRVDGNAPHAAPSELDEPVDLEPAKMRRVLDLFNRLDEMTYYELLGVDGDADKKQLKTAYYGAAPEFHPDKYFRRSLGSYKHKIEAIFARITLAHDVLTSSKRGEYDAYLEQTHKNRTMSAVLDQTERDVAEIMAAVEQAAAQALANQQPVGRYETILNRPPASQRAPASTPASTSSPAPLSGMSPEEALRQRREALARKLSGGRRSVPPSAPGGRPAPAEMDPVVAERAAEALRLRHEAAVAEAKRAQLVRYLESGRAALEQQDFAGAANSYRIAATLAPDDAAVQATCNEALRRAAVALADGYWKQAMYEEGQERWAEAALSYSKVCTGRPESAQAHERVAFATLKSSTNARRAVEFARRAVELDPKKPDYRVTLARAYSVAGLEKSASGELDRALELAPTDPRIKSLVGHARSAFAPKDAK